MKILFVADVFGAPGRRAVETRLPSLREELGADFCIVNGENAAAGRGITATPSCTAMPMPGVRGDMLAGRSTRSVPER